jgi:hypothetical protein
MTLTVFEELFSLHADAKAIKLYQGLWQFNNEYLSRFYSQINHSA